MLKRVLCSTLALSVILTVSHLTNRAQTLSPQAEKIKAKVTKRASDQSRTKVKTLTDTVYVGVLSEVADTSFTLTDKTGNKHSLQYSQVRSVEGAGGGIGWRIGLGAAIGAGVVLGILAAVIA